MIFYLSQTKSERTLFYKQSRESVRNVLSSKFIEFNKTPYSKNSSDNFYNIKVHCFYDNDDMLQEIEIFEPNHVYVIGEVNFLGKQETEFENYLSSLDMEYYSDKMGIVIEHLGISTVSSNNGKIECIYLDLEKSLYLNIY